MLYLLACRCISVYNEENSMPYADEKEQNKKLQEIRNKEEEAFVERVAQKFKLEYIDLSGTGIETDALKLIPEETARRAQIAAFKITGRDVHVAVKSPNLPETKKVLESLRKDYNIGVHLVSNRSLEKAWGRYADISYAENTQGGMLDISPDELVRIANDIKTNEDIAKEVQSIISGEGGKKTTHLMEVIFGGAIATKSSDVHIEAQDEQVRLRFRQDGVLQDITTIDHQSYEKLLSRMKLLAEMKLTQHQNAQDGRFTIDFDEKEIEVRVSVIPSAYGESFVMRILNPDGINVGIENLGIEPRLYEILLKEIDKPNGMILTTGPTGSGKTTTLYSFLRKVYNPEVKIITIEDPIEYHLEGISQTQVNREKGYTFLSGLRAALRQDPDIVMVGEIRDSETATIAVNASLTGHLVLSTLHTNGAAGVIPRLIDLGVSPQILAASLSVSIAQRLVRKVCENCKYQEPANPQEEQLIRDILKEAEKNNKKLNEYGITVDQEILLTRGKGCEVCNGTGYKGRIGIFEAIITDELIEELLNKEPSEQDVRRVAEKQGLLNMREDGIVKIFKGVTSLEEIQSVIDLDIRNITKLESSTPTPLPEPVVEESFPVIETKSNVDPSAILSDKSIEVSLLLDYLQKLEHEQTVNPDIDASGKIKVLEKTILNLLKESDIHKIFGGRPEDATPKHQALQGITKELSELHAHQQVNPKQQVAPKLRQIKDDLMGITEQHHS